VQPGRGLALSTAKSTPKDREDGRTLECLEPGIYERRRPGKPSQIILQVMVNRPLRLRDRRGDAAGDIVGHRQGLVEACDLTAVGSFRRGRDLVQVQLLGGEFRA
jgi:hypothetical protein